MYSQGNRIIVPFIFRAYCVQPDTNTTKPGLRSFSICTATDRKPTTSSTTHNPLGLHYFLFWLLLQMTSFASLMALSATHTKESQRVVEDALQERRRKEAQQKKQREEKEAKEREQQRKLIIRRFEDEKREEERQRRLVVEQQAKKLALQRREDAQRDALRYGPKKAAKLAGKHSSGSRDSPNWPSSSSSNREAVRKLRDPNDDDDGPSGLALTREEIRQRKHQADLQKTFKSAKRSTATGGYSKHGKRLAGGVFDIKTSGPTAELSAGQSVKKRLTSLPMTLNALGEGRKKDKRLELEILHDSKMKRQVLEGDEARNFDGYFTLTKKEKARAQAVSASATTSGADFLVLLNCDFV